MFPIKEFENRFRAILDDLDARTDGSEDFEELNAEFEDAICILEEIDLREDDWAEEFADALDDFTDLAERYRDENLAVEEAERILKLVAFARMNLKEE